MAGETALLERWRSGDTPAFDELWQRVYSDLHRIATREFRRERPGHTLQPTALVHESYLRMVEGAGRNAGSRRHFLALGALIIRRVLVDHFRVSTCLRREGSQTRVALPADPAPQSPLRAADSVVDLIALDEALDTLADIDNTAARIVVLRYFGGLTLHEIVLEVGVSRATVTRKWDFAKAWLRGALADRND